MQSPPPLLAAVILAAGGSRRMGSAKALIHWQGRTWVEHHVAALAPRVDRVVVVLGAEAERIAAVLPAGVEVVRNDDWRVTGMAESLALALATLPVAAQVIVTPVDVPPVPAAVLSALLARGAPVVPTAGGLDAHPVLLRAGPTLAALAGRTLREVLATAPRAELGWSEGLRNLNTPEELRAWMPEAGVGAEGPLPRRGLLQVLALGAAGACLAPGRALAQAPPASPVPSPSDPTAPSPTPTPRAWVNFVVNVQDFRYLDTSADTVVQLAALFTRHGVQGDFYLNGPMCERYLARRPDAIEALRGQGLCYHVRPPHPLFDGFDGWYESARPEELPLRVAQAESRALDLSTATLDPDRPGGFALVKDTFGRAPSTVAMPNPDPAIRKAACAHYREQGAKAVVWYHAARTKVDQPYEWQQGLLARPCDAAVDRWALPGERGAELWWNRQEHGRAGAEGTPRGRIEALVEAWTAPRPPFVVSLVHEDNFTRRGPDAWVFTYWADRKKERPLSPPYDLQAPDPGSSRGKAEQGRIMDAYEEAVAYAAANLRVVTMEQVAAMAGPAR